MTGNAAAPRPAIRRLIGRAGRGVALAAAVMAARPAAAAMFVPDSAQAVVGVPGPAAPRHPPGALHAPIRDLSSRTGLLDIIMRRAAQVIAGVDVDAPRQLRPVRDRGAARAVRRGKWLVVSAASQPTPPCL